MVAGSSPGATELGLITDVEHRAYRDKDPTTGLPFPGVNIIVLDDADQPLPPGEVGQVFVTHHDGRLPQPSRGHRRAQPPIRRGTVVHPRRPRPPRR